MIRCMLYSCSLSQLIQLHSEVPSGRGNVGQFVEMHLIESQEYRFHDNSPQ